MKKFSVFLTVFLACAIIIVLAFTSCDNGSITSGGNNFTNTNWRSSYGFSANAMVKTRLSFLTSSDWAIYAYEMGMQQLNAGTYTVSGGTATLISLGQEVGKATISGNTLTLVGVMAQAGSTWIKE